MIGAVSIQLAYCAAASADRTLASKIRLFFCNFFNSIRSNKHKQIVLLIYTHSNAHAFAAKIKKD